MRIAQFPYKALTEGEEIVAHVRPHVMGLFLPTLRAVLWVAVFSFFWGLTMMLDASTTADTVRLALLAMLLLVLWVRAIRPVALWGGSTMVVTNYRILYRTGTFSKQTLSLALQWIQMVEVRQSLWGRMWGFGSLYVSSYEVGGLQFDQMPRPYEIETAIRQEMAEMMPPGMAPAGWQPYGNAADYYHGYQYYQQ